MKGHKESHNNFQRRIALIIFLYDNKIKLGDNLKRVLEQNPLEMWKSTFK